MLIATASSIFSSNLTVAATLKTIDTSLVNKSLSDVDNPRPTFEQSPQMPNIL